MNTLHSSSLGYIHTYKIESQVDQHVGYECGNGMGWRKETKTAVYCVLNRYT